MSEGSTAPPSAELERLAEIASEVLKLARARGAEQAEVSLSVDQGLNVNVRLGEVETLEHTRDRGLSLTVYIQQRKGSATTADLAPASIAATLDQALNIARFTEADPCAGLAEAGMLASAFPDLDLWHPWSISADEAIELARSCEQAGMTDPRIRNSEGAAVSTQSGYGIYANSHGFIGREHGTSHSLSVSLIAGPDDAMERDYWYDSKRSAADLQNAQYIGAEAARRTLARLDARKLSTRTAPVLYVPELSGGLIGGLIGAVSGGAQYRKASFLLDAVGQKLLPDWFRVHEQPHLKRAMGSANFDSEGVATHASDLVTAGVLVRYVLSSYSARKLGLRSTGNAGGVHNLTVQANAGELSDMLQKMHTGLVVTELMGQGVNPITGDYSRGAAGFWVENGQIAYPVAEITIAGNLKDIYRNLVAVGSDVNERGSIRTGSILVEQMTIAG